MTTLKTYLAREGLTMKAFAEKAKLPISTVSRAASIPGWIPSPDTMRAIHAASNGEVTPNDFFGLDTGSAA